MGNFGKRIGSRRWLKRRRVGIPALAVSDGFAGALIQDLTMTGARLLGRDLPGPKTRLLLKVGKRSLAGEVVWSAGDHRGVCFDFARRAGA